MINKNKLGLIIGSFFGLLHAAWSLLVAVGWAGALLNFIFGLHFLIMPVQLMDFNLITAVELVVVTSVIGYIVGWVLAFLWNTNHK